MDWKAFTNALEASAFGAEEAAKNAGSDQIRERTLLVSDILFCLVNAFRAGLPYEATPLIAQQEADNE